MPTVQVLAPPEAATRLTALVVAAGYEVAAAESVDLVVAEQGHERTPRIHPTLVIATQPPPPLDSDDVLVPPFPVESLARALELMGRRAADRRALFQLLMPGAVAAAETEVLRGLDAQRDLALHGYFLALRAATMAVDQALEVWDLLEPQEASYDKTRFPGLVKSTSTARSRSVASLTRGYEQMLMVVRATVYQEGSHRLSTRSPWQVERARFERFYTRVRQGLVGTEQVRVACTVRRLPPRSRVDNPRLEEIYAALWG